MTLSEALGFFLRLLDSDTVQSLGFLLRDRSATALLISNISLVNKHTLSIRYVLDPFATFMMAICVKGIA